MVSGFLFTIAAVNFVYVINNVHENRLSIFKNEQISLTNPPFFNNR
jgi:hypothetical protein